MNRKKELRIQITFAAIEWAAEEHWKEEVNKTKDEDKREYFSLSKREIKAAFKQKIQEDASSVTQIVENYIEAKSKGLLPLQGRSLTR